MDLALNNGKIFFRGKFVQANIGIEGKKIAEIAKGKIKAEQEIDCFNKIVLPGLIDCHVHFRMPGAEHKEDWNFGSMAAVHGGVTTVLDMPNNLPPITTAKLLEEKRKRIAGKTYCNFGLFFGATSTNSGEISNAKNIAGIKIYMGSSTGTLLVSKKEEQKKVFEIGKKLGKTVVVHAENEELIKENISIFEKENSPEIHSKIRSNKVAQTACRQALELQKLAKNKLHIAHASTKEEMQLISMAKKSGKNLISCETTPSHLFLDRGQLAEKRLQNFAKVNPPLREKSDIMALWNGLKNGTIDCIATDHAPHLPEEKKKNYWEAPSGIPGIETMLPLLLNSANAKKISLEKIVELCCENPAKIFKIAERGKIEKNFFADLAVIDLNKSQKIENSELFTKCKWSPFNGWKLKGVVDTTIVNGKIAFNGGKIVGEKNGKEIEFF